MYSFALLANETILKNGLACLELDEFHLYGALYLTNERLLFIGYTRMNAFKHKVEIDLAHIEHLQTKKTLSLFDNAIQIMTFQGFTCTIIIDQRDQWATDISQQMDIV